MSEKEKRPFHQKAAYRYFGRLHENKQEAEDEFHIINEKEREAIKKIKRFAIISAALTGALSVSVYYVPLIFFENTFNQFSQVISLFGFEMEVNFVTISFSLLLILLEIFILTRINIRSVANTANACGFPDPNDPHHDEHLEQLFHVGLETKNKETLKFGIDPYAGIPKFYIFLFTVWNLIKATLTNFFVKMIVVKIFARAEIRSGLRSEFSKYSDLVGAPVFAIWNAVASWRIIENAKIYIMAPGVIHQLIEELKHLKNDEYFKQNLFDSMQYIVSVKRNFHHNHYLLVSKLIHSFELEKFEDKESNPTAFLEKIKNSGEENKKAYSKLIMMGVFIDGSVSFKEKRILKRLYEEKIINIDPTKVNRWSRQFKNGKGLDEFIKN